MNVDFNRRFYIKRGEINMNNKNCKTCNICCHKKDDINLIVCIVSQMFRLYLAFSSSIGPSKGPEIGRCCLLVLKVLLQDLSCST